MMLENFYVYTQYCIYGVDVNLMLIGFDVVYNFNLPIFGLIELVLYLHKNVSLFDLFIFNENLKNIQNNVTCIDNYVEFDLTYDIFHLLHSVTDALLLSPVDNCQYCLKKKMG